MRRMLLVAAIGLLAGLPISSASTGGISPAQLQRAGWDCLLPPPDFNPNVHCLPPGQIRADLFAGHPVRPTHRATSTAGCFLAWLGLLHLPRV